MSSPLVVLLGLSVGTYALKSAGPLLLADRALPPRLERLTTLLPVALLTALVVVSAVGDGQGIAVDARLVGTAVAGVALWRRAPFVVVVLLAVAATAIVRTVGG